MKRIEEIDKNFQLNASLPQDYVYYDPRNAPFSIWGLVPNEEGSYCRLPLSFLPECSENIRNLAMDLAGGCIRFSTDSPGMCILFDLLQEGNMPHFTACGQSGMELVEESDEARKSVKNVIPKMANNKGCLREQSSYFPLPGDGKIRHYALYLPLYNGCTKLALGFAPSAKIEEGRTPRVEKPLVFYGSSITQGGCAGKAASCYTTLLARRLDAAQINLGFSGSAMGEETIAHYIAGLTMSAFIMDYDHNTSLEGLKNTHEKFFRIIRDAQPNLPIIMMSKPDFDPYVIFNRLRRDVIVATYANALSRGDKHVFYIDGESFFGNVEREDCYVDGCHPNDIGFLRMADRIEPILRSALIY